MQKLNNAAKLIFFWISCSQDPFYVQNLMLLVSFCRVCKLKVKSGLNYSNISVHFLNDQLIVFLLENSYFCWFWSNSYLHRKHHSSHDVFFEWTSPPTMARQKLYIGLPPNLQSGFRLRSERHYFENCFSFVLQWA